MEIDKQAFFEKYAPIAIQQQIKYGIPSSITLAQMAWESSYGTGKPALYSNNFFGVKVGSSWNGPYDLYNDDTANEKFRRYDNVMSSIEDHSKVLMSQRYARCHNYSPTDYRNWAIGIKACGYATDKQYAEKIINFIESNGLSKYDKIALKQSQTYGQQVGSVGVQTQEPNSTKIQLAPMSGHWSLPIQIDGLKVTGVYNEQRSDHRHGGIDISTNKQNMPVYATEDNGTVESVVPAKDAGAAGNMITVEYARQDGTKFRTTYMHLSQIGVKKGDIVNAGQQIGVSGSTGRSTGPHLHFETRFCKSDGNWIKFDPTLYLAELEVRSGINTPLEKNGHDLLSDNRNQMQVSTPLEYGGQNQQLLAQVTNSNDPSKWLAYLMDNNKEGDSGRDMISELISTMFTAAMTVAMSLRTSEEAEAEELSRQELKNNSAQDSTIKMSRETIDAQKGLQYASAAFETEDNVDRQQTMNTKYNIQ